MGYQLQVYLSCYQCFYTLFNGTLQATRTSIWASNPSYSLVLEQVNSWAWFQQDENLKVFRPMSFRLHLQNHNNFIATGSQPCDLVLTYLLIICFKGAVWTCQYVSPSEGFSNSLEHNRYTFSNCHINIIICLSLFPLLGIWLHALQCHLFIIIKIEIPLWIVNAL